MPDERRGPDRRALLAALLGGAAGVVLPAAASIGREPAEQRLRRGINLFPWFSLTREYPAPRTDYPWPPFQQGRPTPTASDLARLRRAGFDFVRLPIDPGPFIADGGAHREPLMREVLEAVRLAREADLSVMVNLHVNTATHFWNARTLVSAPDAPGFQLYLEFATALAAGLGRLGTSGLLFEPANEPPQDCASTHWHTMQEMLLQATADAAPGLALVASGACGAMIAGLEELAPPRVDAPLFYTFHFYEPYLFTHQGATWMGERKYHYLADVAWPGAAGSLDEALAATRLRLAADRSLTHELRRRIYDDAVRSLTVYYEAAPAKWFVERYLRRIDDWSAAHGVPMERIVLGEFGAIRPGAQSTLARARYIADVRESAEAMGIPWAFWNLFDRMGMMDETTRVFDPLMIEALGLREA